MRSSAVIAPLALGAGLLLIIACRPQESKTPEPNAETEVKTYGLRGEVIEVIPEDRLAVIRHEDIPGWMKAMTMDFPVKDPADFEKLKPGVRIEAKVYVKGLDFWLGDISVVEEPAGGPQ